MTVEGLAKVVAEVQAGGFAAAACKRADVAVGTLRYWRRKRSRGGPVDGRVAALLDALEVAEARIEVALLADVRSGAPGWRSSAWLLERRFPSRWGAGARRGGRM